YTEETSGVQVIIEEEEKNGHVDAGTRRVGDVILLPQASQSNVRYFIAAIEKHKLGAIMGILALAIMAAGIFYFTRPGEAIDSVAVMPFVNVPGDPNAEYLADGISDSIINNLSQL